MSDRIKRAAETVLVLWMYAVYVFVVAFVVVIFVHAWSERTR